MDVRQSVADLAGECRGDGLQVERPVLVDVEPPASLRNPRLERLLPVAWPQQEGVHCGTFSKKPGSVHFNLTGFSYTTGPRSSQIREQPDRHIEWDHSGKSLNWRRSQLRIELTGLGSKVLMAGETVQRANFGGQLSNPKRMSGLYALDYHGAIFLHPGEGKVHDPA